MAKKLNTYQLFRIIHFYSASIAGIFLLLFFISGYLIVRYSWYNHDAPKPTVTSHNVCLPPYSTDLEFAKWVKSELQLTGKIEWIGKPKEDETHIEIMTPRTFHLVKVSHSDQTLTHETRPQTTHEMLSVIHRMHGYGGGFWYDVYLFMMDIASFSLLIFVITGVYLWLKVIKIKWLGWMFLLLGLGYTGWMVYAFLK